MARTNARLIRFGIFATVLILCGYILSRGSSTSYAVSDTTKSTSSSDTTNAANAAVTDANLKDTSVVPAAAGAAAAGAAAGSTSGKAVSAGGKEKATFVSLARNSDLWELVGSIRQVEDRFNSKFHYDWVFLNDEEFNDEFKRVTTELCSGNTKYGVIPHEQWSFPSWIDTEKAAKTREDMREKKIIYGDSIPYRHMCRYESGFFFRHPLLDDYEWYWRVEPGIKIFCDVDYDVFKFMKDNKKTYGFTISLPEYKETILTLWDETKKFVKENPQYIPESNMRDFISDDGGVSYNGCHFWSNFEIASLDFWRSEAYLAYFEHLDQAGGFFYERWGDAPVHSIAAALFLPKGQIHFFDDVGYYHVPFNNCPVDQAIRSEKNCMCNPKDDFTFKGYSCTSKFYNLMNLKKPQGWERYAD
ncbi:glycosyltransferase family 15 protein [[Candida] arabinofermentans NRRL YB-2248]|uniref:Glycosyltransferase family 15 protein n=1 Tax=[Candida] arabinofermentans NRRL YB-2248 TaxID=983967 RepID=A0A1E4SU31_9ASCO|nr:glycosyltransferase family 15 protein [[Candida] arabinofermentans NRRL YB-2248]